MRRASALTSSVLAVLFLAGCPKGGIPGRGDGKGNPDPNACGDASVKIKSFLEATVALNDAVAGLEADVKVSCQAIAEELGVPTEGDTAKVCNAVSAAIKANLKAGLKGRAKLTIDYKPAVCEVKADIAAEAAAKCEGKASADVKVECTGKCEGTCDGTCKGSCSGGCSGSADVDASVECEAKAEVTANVEAECTPPELDIKFDASAVADAPKVEMTVKAIKKGLPKLIAVKAKLQGPVALAFKSWAKAAGGLKGSVRSAGLCVGAQLGMAVGLLAQIQGSMSVSVKASVSVSGSASGSAG